MTTVHSVSLRGLTGDLLTFTATVIDGPPALILTGDHGRYQRELRDRVHAALANSGLPHRDCRVEVHLNEPTATPPAAAIAVAMLIATATRAGDMPNATERIAGTAVLGEVGLDGSLRPTSGTLPAVQVARAHGFRQVIVPVGVVGHAALVDGVTVLGAYSLADVADWLRGNDTALRRPRGPLSPVAAPQPSPAIALTTELLHAVTVAAAGGHHLLCDLATGAGTDQAASWLHALLPDLTPDEQIELAAIQSLRGPYAVADLVLTPPLVIAYHGNSRVVMVGGGHPGLVSQAQHGVLFADELDRFDTDTQEALRGTLLHREVLISQADNRRRYPANFQLFATSIGTPGSPRPRMSLALRDLIDIRLSTEVTVFNSNPEAHKPDRIAHLLKDSRAQVAAARAHAAARWSRTGTGTAYTNAQVPQQILHTLPGTAAAADHLHRAQTSDTLTIRAADIVLRLARTLADLDGAEKPSRGHVEQALALRRPVNFRPAAPEVQ